MKYLFYLVLLNRRESKVLFMLWSDLLVSSGNGMKTRSSENDTLLLVEPCRDLIFLSELLEFLLNLLVIHFIVQILISVLHRKLLELNKHLKTMILYSKMKLLNFALILLEYYFSSSHDLLQFVQALH